MPSPGDHDILLADRLGFIYTPLVGLWLGWLQRSWRRAIAGAVVGVGIGFVYMWLCASRNFFAIMVGFPCLLGGAMAALAGSNRSHWLKGFSLRLGKGLLAGLVLGFTYMVGPERDEPAYESSNQRMRNNRSLEAGFTFIELLVVIAIIGVLSALLLGGLTRGKAVAQSAACTSNLRQLGISLQMYVSENHCYPVNRFQTKPLSLPNTDRLWLGKLVRESLGIAEPSTNFQRQGLWRCPSAQWSASMLNGNDINQFTDYGYNDDKFSGRGFRDSTNKFGLQGHYIPDARSASEWTFRAIAEAEVVSPGEMMAIGDCFEANALFMRRPVEVFAEFGNIHIRHRGKANVVFCDGHVESSKLKFLLEDTSDTALSRWNRDHQAHPDKW